MSLHGILCSERVWSVVTPMLAREHDVIVAPTALGHRGGARPGAPPVTVEQMVDDTERMLDELELERVHLAGNSMGGWIAFELARRGRALSVCALSPGRHLGDQLAGDRAGLRDACRTVRETRRGRALLPALARSRRFRRRALETAPSTADVSASGSSWISPRTPSAA